MSGIQAKGPDGAASVGAAASADDGILELINRSPARLSVARRRADCAARPFGLHWPLSFYLGG